jgi:hypothetical protein|tara:strand:- start:1536 stop:1856 length:321 start_codon:yes stop_codon:yes gene_type:complete
MTVQEKKIIPDEWSRYRTRYLKLYGKLPDAKAWMKYLKEGDKMDLSITDYPKNLSAARYLVYHAAADLIEETLRIPHGSEKWSPAQRKRWARAQEELITWIRLKVD